MKQKLRLWLPLAAAITVLAGTIYVAVQQDMRQSFNEPQVSAIEGSTPQDLIGGTDAVVNVVTDITPFLVAYDPSGKPIGGNGLLDGKLPVPPAGVFNATKAHGEDHVTWQPRPDVRIAAVIRYFSGDQGGYLLSGANMRELEAREQKILMLVLFGWASALILSFAATLLV